LGSFYRAAIYKSINNLTLLLRAVYNPLSSVRIGKWTPKAGAAEQLAKNSKASNELATKTVLFVATSRPKTRIYGPNNSFIGSIPKISKVANAEGFETW
jgi:hypothetical protein